MFRRAFYRNNYKGDRSVQNRRLPSPVRINDSTVVVEFLVVECEPKKILDRSGEEGDFERQPDFPNSLGTVADYTFENQRLVVLLSSKLEWKPVSFIACYDFSKQKIVMENFPSLSNNRTLKLEIDLKDFDRHCLHGHFTFEITFVYLEEKDAKVRTVKYKADIPYFQVSTPLTFGRLAQYYTAKTMANLYNAKFKMDLLSSDGDRDLLLEMDRCLKNLSVQSAIENPGSAIEMIRYSLSIEDLASQDQLEKYDLKNVYLKVDSANRKNISFCSFRVYPKQLPPNYKEETSLCIVAMSRYTKGKAFAADDAVFASIDSYNSEGYIKFRSHLYNNELDYDSDDGLHQNVFGSSRRSLHQDFPYLVRFIPNRSSYRAGYHALKMLDQNSLQGYFTNFEHTQAVIPTPAIEDFDWLNKQIAANEEQKLAIKNIVNCTAFPFPYVVFGPPGTGKSSLIVEAVAQILKLKPESRILVTAQSNSACDEVGVRLFKHFSSSKIFRYYSSSITDSKTCKELKRISNLRHNKNKNPTMEEYMHFNVIISTLMGCSRLVQIKDASSSFDYIFVDECAAATMPEALIPIVELGTTINKIKSNIVILGDHKQLGPVIHSEMASQLGLRLSLMERIMTKPRYSLDPVTKTYDSKYVTQLLDNFRSHPAILQFSNVMFYDSKLRAKLQEPERSFGTRWEHLPNKKLPMLFDCVKTPSETAKGDTSTFNEGEVMRVRFYVDLLLKDGVQGEKVNEEDIGIVSPYKAQLNMLKEEFKNEVDIEIGTSEYYQGREKKIIIISTVKSGEGVGFLKNEKRLNVCITRAKSLLILVGNAETLQQSPLWNSLLHFLKANNACCGEAFGLVLMTDQEKKLQEKLNAILVDPEAFEKSAEEEKVEHDKAVKAMRDRMAKLVELMREL